MPYYPTQFLGSALKCLDFVVKDNKLAIMSVAHFKNQLIDGHSKHISFNISQLEEEEEKKQYFINRRYSECVNFCT